MTQSNDSGRETLVLAPSMRWVLAGNDSELSQAHGNLLSASGGRDVGSILVTSCHPGEGKTSAAISLAYSVGKYSNQKVLVVDANSADPALHKIFGAPLAGGLTDVVYGGADLRDCMHETALYNVSILTQGNSPESIASLAGEEGALQSGEAESGTIYRSQAFTALLQRLRNEFDMVIFDGPSLLSSSETAWACPHFDGVLLVIACEDTKWEVARLAREKMEAAGGVLLGTILNRRKYYVPANLYKRL